MYHNHIVHNVFYLSTVSSNWTSYITLQIRSLIKTRNTIGPVSLHFVVLLPMKFKFYNSRVTNVDEWWLRLTRFHCSIIALLSITLAVTADDGGIDTGSVRKTKTKYSRQQCLVVSKAHLMLTWQTFFSHSRIHSTRGHSWKLAKQTSNRECRLHFFSLRVINCWNNLTQELVDSASVNSFKSGLQKLRKRKMGFFKDWCPTSPLAAQCNETTEWKRLRHPD